MNGNHLKIEDLNALIELVENQPQNICGYTSPHAIHPNSVKNRFAICAMCFGLVFVGGDE
jgi:hypothetical protein